MIGQNFIWKPSSKFISESNLTKYIKFINQNYAFESSGSYNELWQWSIDNPKLFWDSIWDFSEVKGDKGERILINSNLMPGAKFFPDAELNYAENLLKNSDEKVSIVSIREDGKKKLISKNELKIKVMLMAAWLKKKGIKKGDRVAAYMPNCLETVISMLATSALGAVFSSCSTDFGVAGVLDRFKQIQPKILITVDGYIYNGKKITRDKEINQITSSLPSLISLVIVNYINNPIDEEKIETFQFEELFNLEPLKNFTRINFNDPLYIVFSSGTTGVPKCIVHGVGGVLLQHFKEHKLHLNLSEDDTMFFFSTCGWMMWNWLVGALFCNARIILYEGSPFHQGSSKLWEMTEQEKITIFGTSAKYIDTLKKSGYLPAKECNLASLKSLCSTGSPLSPESFEFINKYIKQDMQIASISGGTDILSCFVLNNPFDKVFKGEIQCRGLGMNVDVFDEKGNSLIEQPGELVCTKPFPSMPIKFWNDKDGSKYKKAYFDFYENIWRHGDWVKLTKRGSMVIYGRSDATLNPGGVRIGTAEIYKIVEAFDEILESIVVGQSWDNDVRIVLFVKLKDGVSMSENLIQRIKDSLKLNVSPRHVPSKILSVPDIPRTRSGKISELAVKDIIHGKKIKNKEALSNPETLSFFNNIKELKE